MMWNLYVGLAVNLVIVLGIYEICSRTEIIYGEDASYLSNAPANRVVLICVDRMNGEPLFDRLNRDRSPLLLKTLISEGAYGLSKTFTPYSQVSGVVALSSGIGISPLSLLTAHCSLKPTLDTVFNSNTSVYHMGDSLNFLYSKIFKTDSWVSLRPDTQSNLSDSKVYKALLLTHLEASVNAEKTILFFQVKNEQKCEMHDSEKLYTLDENIKLITEAVNQAFPDNMTTFIFTSSRGHSQNQHIGYPQVNEYLTPLVAWGAGISPGYKEPISQIDICPLLATILGLKIPRNSQGVLPVNYLSMAEEDLKRVIAINVLHLQSIAQIIIDRIRSGLFRNLKPVFNTTELAYLRSILNSTKFSVTELTTEELLSNESSNKKIIDTYNSAFSYIIFACVLITAWGWNTWLFSCLLLNGIPLECRAGGRLCLLLKIILNLPFLLLIILEVVLVIGQKIEFHYIIYIVTPTLLWCRVCNTVPFWYGLARSLDKDKIKMIAASSLLYTVVSGLTGLFFQFHIPVVFVMLILIVLYPLANHSVILKGAVLIWTTCVILLHGIRNVNTSIISDETWFLISLVVWCVVGVGLTLSMVSVWRDVAVGAVLSLLLITFGCVRYGLKTVDKRDPLEHYIVFLLLGGLPFIASSTSVDPKHRLINSVLALAASFALISHTYELIVFLILCLIIFSWLYLEVSQSSCFMSQVCSQKLAAVYAPLFFMVFILSAQDVMGNIDETRESDIVSWLAIVQNSPGYSIGLRLVYVIVIGECAMICQSALRGTSKSLMFTKILVVFNFIGNQFLIQLSPNRDRQTSSTVSQAIFLHALVIVIIVLYPLAYLLMKLHVCVIFKTKQKVNLSLRENSIPVPPSAP